jgi:succinyl-CoA synthetase beta subunit
VVKAQVFQGHRGQRGGIQLARERSEITALATKLTNLELGGERVKSVYVEERVEKERELYLAAFVDRDRGGVRVLASPDGGVDIERVPVDRIVSVDVDALIGLRKFQTDLLALRVGLRDAAAVAFGDVVRRLYRALVAEDAELIEINPLILTRDGTFIAADAKVVLDDDAMSRHAGRAQPSEWQLDGDFMRRMRELGAIGVDMRGQSPADVRSGSGGIAVLCNGAGVTMATFDLVTHLGGEICGAVEMHGALAAGKDHAARVVEGLRLLAPGVVLINGFYQLRACDTFAAAIVDAIGRSPGWIAPARVVVRMRGVNSREAIEMLERAGCRATSSLTEACSIAVEVSRRTPSRSSA